MTTKFAHNRAKDFVDQCSKRFHAVKEQAGSDYIVKVFCSTSTGEWQAKSMAPASEDLITFQSFDGVTQTFTVAAVEQVAMHLRVTKREPNEKQPQIDFKKIGFHTFTSIKSG
ncbi:MAG: hypothetical protein NT154_01750 [Verrucomicrobia bacterium]|nr:hypothetical protein [Verrucomicrobiota bacterium]